ncbi:hypothetical protein MFIFM68171_10411 [Madurella fahalii]|uniref:Apple domain-containing protein n=1 Tax=Madurella fahalii TaxID=1157608 RepID=A0ABQ0GR34_9PEZI
MASRPLQPDIHGTDIELVPTRRPFQEHETNPGLEVVGHSTLELASYQLPHAHQFATPSPFTGLSPASTALPKSWEKLHSESNNTTRPTTPYTLPTTTPEYSEIDFSSPFDRRPLVDPPGEADGRKRARICGVRRQLFWVLLAVGVFLVVAAIATGVGVGLGLAGRSDGDSDPASASNRTLPLPLITSPLPSASDAVQIACPANNLTLYTPQQTNPARKYLLLCGRDYNSNRGSVDMYNLPAATMAECIDLCAAQEGCRGAGWGRGICWLKSELAVWHEAPAWYFVVEDVAENGGGG